MLFIIPVTGLVMLGAHWLGLDLVESCARLVLFTAVVYKVVDFLLADRDEPAPQPSTVQHGHQTVQTEPIKRPVVVDQVTHEAHHGETAICPGCDYDLVSAECGCARCLYMRDVVRRADG